MSNTSMSNPHSNRSSSPQITRPCTANLEKSSSIRKSVSGSNHLARPSVVTNSRSCGNPVTTPANSPSDFARRHSVGKDDLPEKENEEKDHNLKPATVQSQAKGSKNFMAPTISAASKFTPSPRKKVLVERSEPVRTSISLSDGRAMFFSAIAADVYQEPVLKSKPVCHQKDISEDALASETADPDKKEAVVEAGSVTKPLKRASSIDISESTPIFEPASAYSDSVNLGSSFERGALPYLSPIAPLDADPSAPPYDPKTNYLSPRPQFLRYRPNPRIQNLLNKDIGLGFDEFEPQLEYSFSEVMPDSLSDSEGSEEFQGEEYQKEDRSDTDVVIGVEQKEEESRLSEDSETFPVSTAVEGEPVKEIFIEKIDKKPWGSKLICGFVFMLLLIACGFTAVTHSSVINVPTYTDLPFSILHWQSSVVPVAKENFEGLARYLNQFSLRSRSYVVKLITELRRRDDKGSMQFLNHTFLQKDGTSCGDLLNNQVVEDYEENSEGIKSEEDIGDEIRGFDEEEDQEDVDEEEASFVDYDEDTEEEELVREDGVVEDYEEDFEGNESEEDIGDEIKGFDEASLEVDYAEDTEEEELVREDDVFETKDEFLSSMQHVDLEPELSDIDGKQEEIYVDAEMHKDMNAHVQSAADLQDNEITFKAETVDVKPEMAEPVKVYGYDDLPSAVQADIASGINPLNENVILESCSYYAVGIFSLLAVLPFAAFFCKSRKKFTLAGQKNPLPSEKYFNKENPLSYNWPAGSDVIGESCPSEISSFQRGSSYSKEVPRRGNDAQSYEKKSRKHLKRESLASSSEFSMGSPSYGSFTTYERIQKKKADRENEIITPVRRSSRIRSQVTSS